MADRTEARSPLHSEETDDWLKAAKDQTPVQYADGWWLITSTEPEQGVQEPQMLFRLKRVDPPTLKSKIDRWYDKVVNA